VKPTPSAKLDCVTTLAFAGPVIRLLSRKSEKCMRPFVRQLLRFGERFQNGLES
jgi:hypothetical protein